MAVKFSDLDIDNFVNEYGSGLSARNIAGKYGVTHYAITCALRERGIHIRSKAEQGQMGLVARTGEIVGLYLSGSHPRDIAYKFSCTEASVYKILKSSGTALRKRSTAPTADVIIEEYTSGTSAPEIAKRYGCGRTSVYRVLAANGVDANDYTPAINVASAIKLFDTGIGLKGVADILGCSSTFMRRIFERNGIDTRDRSQQQFARMARMTPEERSALTKPSHDAVRGVKQTTAILERRAQSRAKMVSGYELELMVMLSERGIVTDPQFPIGIYNCDLAAHPVMVEVFGGHWHWTGKHLASIEKRFRYILNAGWHLLVIPVTQSSPLTPAVADYVAAYIQEARSNPTARREYRVVWRAGEYFTAGSLEDDKISIEPPFTNSRNSASGRYEAVAR